MFMFRLVLGCDRSGKLRGASLPRRIGRVAVWWTIQLGSAGGWSRPGARKGLPHFAVVTRNREYLSQSSPSLLLWLISIPVHFELVFDESTTIIGKLREGRIREKSLGGKLETRESRCLHLIPSCSLSIMPQRYQALTNISHFSANLTHISPPLLLPDRLTSFPPMATSTTLAHTIHHARHDIPQHPQPQKNAHIRCAGLSMSHRLQSRA